MKSRRNLKVPKVIFVKLRTENSPTAKKPILEIYSDQGVNLVFWNGPLTLGCPKLGFPIRIFP